MSVPFLGLELLEKKVIPNKQGEIRIRFGQAEAKVEDLAEEGEITEEVEIKPRARPMAILDKRSTSTVNRQQILERLKKNNALTVKSELLMKRPYEIPADIPQPELLQPVAIKKRLVLKESGIKLVPKKQEVLEVETQGEDEDVEAELKKMAQFVELQAPALTEEEFKEQRVEAAILESQEPKKAKKLRVKPGPAIVPEIDLTTVAIRSQKVSDRLPKEKEKVLIKAPTYYMNNRKLFIQKLTELFNPYRDDIIENAETASCDSSQSTEFDLLTHQKIVRDYLNLYTPYRGLLLYHGLGAGKCHAKGTKIMLHTGEMKLVEDIEVGDLLMGDDSRPRTVLSLARGRDKMYDIVPVKGEKYTVNQEHILCLKASGFPKLSFNNHKANTNYNVQWIEDNKFCSRTFTFNKDNEAEMKSNAEKFFEQIKTSKETSENVYEIAVKDYLKISNKQKGFLKGYRVPVDFPEKELPIDPYMIGYWLGDGTSCRSAITSQDSTVLYYFAKNLPQYNLSLSHHSKYDYGIVGNGKYNNNAFTNTLKDLNMKNNKHIPMIYKCNSRENRLKLLAGLIDSDGSLSANGGFEFTQKNETLMDDVVYLARSLGFSCYKKEKKTSWTYNGVKQMGTAFRITISGDGIDEIPTLIPRKRSPPRKQIKDVLVTGISVEYVGEDDYYGFMLDGNCRYIIGDFTVTHNTCTSIAIAEGMKSNKRVFVLTPASLKMNFFSEMKKCGDALYKKNQFWEFVSIDGNPEYVGVLARALSLSAEYIRKHRGGWLVNITKESNFTELSTEEQTAIDEQLNEMIRSKYTDINYNGMNRNKLNLLTGDMSRNPFDNSVVIIDEAHNFVSRIVNKIKVPDSISFILYDLLMKATNAKIVLLT